MENLSMIVIVTVIVNVIVTVIVTVIITVIVIVIVIVIIIVMNDTKGDLEREVVEMEERAAEAAKLMEPRENSYIEFRVRIPI